MKNKTWRRYIIWILPVVAAFALAVLPQAVFAVETEEPDLPVGGWSPVELIEVPEDVDIGKVPPAKKKARKAIKGDSDSVFVGSASTVGFDALSTDAQKQYYQLIDTAAVAFMNGETETEIREVQGNDYYTVSRLDYSDFGMTIDEAKQAFYAYDYDHPAYYWISNSLLYGGSSDVSYLILCTEEEYTSVSARQEINTMVINGVKSYAALAEKGTDTLDEIALVHDKIVNDVDYAFDNDGVPVSAKWAHSVHGVFDPDYRQVVCEGYADTFAMVMNYLDIPNYYIVGIASNIGTGGGGGHAWNAVSADGGKSYLYMDLTWDDFGGEEGYSYPYFGMPATDFETSHVKNGPDGTGSQWLYDIPETLNDSFEGTYFKQGGFYYDNSVSNVETFATDATAKASRAGRYVSVMASKPSDLWGVADALGAEYSYYTESYKGTDYYYIIAKTGEVHAHDWSEPEYTWSSDNKNVTAVRICEAPNCEIGMEVETVATTYNIIDATCEDDGIETYTAEFKNEAFTAQTKEIIIEALGHAWGDWEVVQEATEDEPGLQVRTCQNDPNHKEEKVIPPLSHPHVMISYEETPAGCEEDGNTAYWQCTQCDKYFADAEGEEEIEEDSWIIPALGHDYGDWTVTKEATCTEKGSRYAKCSRCNQILEEEITALGEHEWEHYKAAPGLLTNGTEYDYCTVCGEKKNVRTLAGYAAYYVKSLKVAKAKKAFKVKWAKQSAANQKKFNGYQIRYSLKSNMAGAKYATAAKSSKSKKIKKLQKKKKYYVQVRTYTVKDGITYYSKWSAKKKVKTK